MLWQLPPEKLSDKNELFFPIETATPSQLRNGDSTVELVDVCREEGIRSKGFRGYPGNKTRRGRGMRSGSSPVVSIGQTPLELALISCHSSCSQDQSPSSQWPHPKSFTLIPPLPSQKPLTSPSLNTPTPEPSQMTPHPRRATENAS